MDKSKQKQEVSLNNFIVILVVISIIVVFGGGFLSYSVTKNLLHTKRILDKKTVAQKVLDADVNSAKSLISDYDAASSQKTLLSDVLPIDPDFPDFANAVEVISAVSGAQLTNVSAGGNTAATTVSAAGPTQLPVTIAATVSNANLVKFLSTLESSARPLYISGLSIAGTNNALALTIDAATYYQAPTSFKITTETVK